MSSQPPSGSSEPSGPPTGPLSGPGEGGPPPSGQGPRPQSGQGSYPPGPPEPPTIAGGPPPGPPAEPPRTVIGESGDEPGPPWWRKPRYIALLAGLVVAAIAVGVAVATQGSDGNVEVPRRPRPR
ncbi:hypothetical protein ACFQ1I_01260 [Kitasatospora arboriphila]